MGLNVAHIHQTCLRDCESWMLMLHSCQLNPPKITSLAGLYLWTWLEQKCHWSVMYQRIFTITSFVVSFLPDPQSCLCRCRKIATCCKKAACSEKGQKYDQFCHFKSSNLVRCEEALVLTLYQRHPSVLCLRRLTKKAHTATRNAKFLHFLSHSQNERASLYFLNFYVSFPELGETIRDGLTDSFNEI